MSLRKLLLDMLSGTCAKSVTLQVARTGAASPQEALGTSP